MLDGELDPRTARTPAEFVALLRKLKAWSGRTYREIARQAAAHGDALPTSTAQDILHREALPREEQVGAFARACGLSEQDAAVWVQERRRLATASEEPVAFALEALPPPAQGRGRSLAKFAAVGAGVALLLTLSASRDFMPHTQAAPQTTPTPTSGGMPSRPVTPQPALPIDGTYQLRLAHTGMCVVEKDMDDTGMLYQAPCKFDVVKRVLERQQGGSYLIRTLHPVFGPGCMGVPSDQDGPLLKVEDGYCMDDKRFEQFTFEPVSKPAQGYRIRTAKTGHCLGIQGGSRMEWSKLVQLKCDLNAASQVFVLTRP